MEETNHLLGRILFFAQIIVLQLGALTMLLGVWLGKH